MKATRRSVALLLLIVLAGLPACEPTPSASSPDQTLTLLKVKAAVPPNLSNAPFFIAQAEGYFADQGLEVELATIADSIREMPALDSGEVDVLAGQIAVAHLNAMAHGSHLKIVADKGHFEVGNCSPSAYVVRPGLRRERKLDGPADLKGLRVGVKLASYLDYRLETFLARGNLTVNDVQLQDLDPKAAVAALEQGAVDVAELQEPALTEKVLTGKAEVWMAGDKITPDKQIAYVIFGPSIVDRNPEVGRRFMVAYLKAVRQYNRGKTDRNLDIVAKYIIQDRELLKRACWQAISNDGRIDVASIVHFADWALKKKLLDTSMPVTQFWDPSFIDYANQVLPPGH